ncbi:MAG: hypothetical protein ABMA64_38175, partial [Myxococcota bacterium]
MGKGHTPTPRSAPPAAAMPGPELAAPDAGNTWAAAGFGAPATGPTALPPLLAAAAAPPLTDEERGSIEASVAFIAESLKEQWLDPGDEQEIVDHVAQWASVDERVGGTARLDRLLSLLAARAVTRATARSAWVDTTVGVLDTLWTELEDARLRVEALLAEGDVAGARDLALTLH